MKVCLITFHFVSNHGGVLQAYALQNYLERYCCEVEVIDYRPSYHTVRYSTWKNPFSYMTWYWKRFRHRKIHKRVMLSARSFARAMYMNIRRTDAKTEKAFRAFIDHQLHLTRRYKTIEALRLQPPACDAMICGSDQLWNPDVLDYCFDPAYFLDFGSSDIPHVAYAVSLGRGFTDEELKQVKQLSQRLTAISLRENDPKTIEAMGKDVHICLDPTLLLDAVDYGAAESASGEKEPYIFVYGFEDNEDIHQAVALARKKYGCTIINGSSHRIHLQGEVKCRNSYGPDTFLTLIRDAQCVVTNSFHGTAFSVVYKKDFITVAHTTRSARMTELLSKLAIDNRLWNSPTFNFDGEPDFVRAYERLERLRKHSGEYLEMAIHGKCGEAIPHHVEDAMVD